MAKLGSAFRFVTIGVCIFALSRIDDVLKVSGTWAKMGIELQARPSCGCRTARCCWWRGA